MLTTLLYLPVFIDTPDMTLPELKSFVLGEKVSEGYTPYEEIIDSTPPLATWFYGLCNIMGRSLTVRHIVAFLILFFQSAFLGIVLIDKKVFSENTYIPSFLFLLLTFISYDMLALSADLLAFGFLLLALNNLFKEIEFRVQRDETIFNLGIFISLASLLNFSCVLYLPGAMIILAIFTRNTLRKYLLLLFGFLLPHLLLVTSYFFMDSGEQVWQLYYLHNLSFATSSLMGTKSLLLLSAIPLFYLFVSLFILGRDARLTKYQSQIFQAMFIWFLVALTQVLLTEDLRPQSLIPLFPPVSFFLTHFLLLIRRRKFVEMNTWVLLIGIITVSYLVRYNQISYIRFEKLSVPQVDSVVQGKRILVLDHQPSWFRNNRLACPFYEWDLCKPVFEQPDYYENVLMVHRSFVQDMPDVIIDPENLMSGFFERLPSLKSKYEKSEEGYRLKKISN